MAFNSSLSGMRAANADLNVTSHNIANVNTTGFKESRAEFAEVFSSTGYGLLRNGIGAGVRLTNVAQQFSQGDINQTGRYLDMAVDKEGFFTVSNNGTNVYTRAGNFQRDPNGYVTTPEGYRLQVFPPRADGIGFDTGNLTDLRLLTTDSPPSPTTRVELGVTARVDVALGPLDEAEAALVHVRDMVERSRPDVQPPPREPRDPDLPKATRPTSDEPRFPNPEARP